MPLSTRQSTRANRGERKEPLDPAHLLRRQHQQITQGSTSCCLESPVNSQLNIL